MKLTELLIATCCTIIAASSENTGTDREALLKRASEQLERLAPYRRTGDQEASSDASSLSEMWRSPEDQNVLDETRGYVDQGLPWEILEIPPEQKETDATKQHDHDDDDDDDGKRITIGIIADPKYSAMMRERIKRGFDAGSASLITSIAGGVLSGVASASSSSAAKASSSSSSSGSGQPANKPSYGPPPPVYPPAYSYEAKPFGPLDFKKAIFSTLFQAIKAIGGGVLALKGQLVKGGGYLLSAKGGVISKTGEVITSFGKQLASSVAAQPKPYPPEDYAYDHPPVQNIGHDSNYGGPPPSADDYSEANDYGPHSTYGVPSNDNDQGGLLIVTPTKSHLDAGNTGQHANAGKPDLIKLEESFGGPAKGSAIKDLLSSVPIGSGVPTGHQTIGQDNNNYNSDNNVDSYPPLEHPAPVYGAADHYPTGHAGPSQDHPDSYQNLPDNYHESVPPGTVASHHFPSQVNDGLSIQPSVEYPPLHVQQFGYPTLPHSGPTGPLLDHAPFKPQHDDDATSVYASLTVDTEPQITHLRATHADYHGAYDLPKLRPHVDFHGRTPDFPGTQDSLEGPLRIHLLNPMPLRYWQGQQGSLMPASALGNPFLKRDVLQRRASANRLARYTQAMWLHRPRRSKQ